MIARAVAKYIRISPKKARLVARTMRGKSVDQALSTLANINKKASEIIFEVIESAANNAKRKYPETKYTGSDLYISKIAVDEGPSLSRYRAASMGRASTIIKRSSHILVELDVIPETLEKLQKEGQKKKETRKLKTETTKTPAKARRK